MERPRTINIILCVLLGLSGLVSLVLTVLLWDIAPLAIFLAYAAGIFAVCAAVSLGNVIIFGPILWMLASVVSFFERRSSAGNPSDTKGS